MSHEVPGAAPEWERLLDMLGFAADWIWEQDADLRFTRLAGRAPGYQAEAGSGFEAIGLYFAHGAEAREAYARAVEERRGVRGLVLRQSLADDTLRFYSVSTAPVFDARGDWSGYRGFALDVTETEWRQHLAYRFQITMDASPDCILISDIDTHKFLYVNDTICELMGFPREELMKVTGYQLTGRTRAQADQLFTELIEAGAVGITDEPHVATSRDGERKGWWEPHHRAAQLDGRWVAITVSREVTGRVLAEQAARRAKQMYAALSATNEAIIHARTPEDLFARVCMAAVEAGGLTTACILLKNPETANLYVAAISGVGEQSMRSAVISVDPERPEGHGLNGLAYRTGQPAISNDFQKDPRTGPWHKVARVTNLRSAAAIPVMMGGAPTAVLYLCAGEKRAFDGETVTLLQRMADNLSFALLTLEHEADRQRAEERVRYLATHDSLTGLPNRAMFGELLEQAIVTARRYHHRPGVMFIDLDRFKLVNDSLGHAAGDLLLVEMAKRLRSVLRESDVLARLGGDEFVILLQAIRDERDAEVVARKLLDAALESLNVLGQDCRVTASIGISLFPEHGEDQQTLMKNADTAMYLAKEKGKNTFEFFVPGMQSLSNERLVLEAALRNALINNEFALNYQAKLDLRSNRITGVEALLRWYHPELGEITPQQFIPLCEESGAIIPIGRWVLNAACQQNMEWQRQGLPPVKMAVNLSARQFSDPDLLGDIESALRDSGMEPSLLELELTESMVMLDPAHTVQVLTQLRAMGVRTALDDFGVGYSSLAQIKGFPIDTLKVDRSFIRNLPESDHDRAITEAIINMARTLSLTVIAEGVETEAQERFLRGIACDESQGFYFSKPTTAEVFSQLLRSHGVTADEDTGTL